MSRYQIPGKNPKHNVVLGWDNPLQTFFADVFDNDEDNDCIFTVGCAPSWMDNHEVKDLVTLQKLLAPYANIPQTIRLSLQQDYDNRSEPTSLQKKMKELFNGNEI